MDLWAQVLNDGLEAWTTAYETMDALVYQPRLSFPYID